LSGKGMVGKAAIVARGGPWCMPDVAFEFVPCAVTLSGPTCGPRLFLTPQSKRDPVQDIGLLEPDTGITLA
jgi:hypothetical protein